MKKQCFGKLLHSNVIRITRITEDNEIGYGGDNDDVDDDDHHLLLHHCVSSVVPAFHG